MNESVCATRPHPPENKKPVSPADYTSRQTKKTNDVYKELRRAEHVGGWSPECRGPDEGMRIFDGDLGVSEKIGSRYEVTKLEGSLMEVPAEARSRDSIAFAPERYEAARWAFGFRDRNGMRSRRKESGDVGVGVESKLHVPMHGPATNRIKCRHFLVESSSERAQDGDGTGAGVVAFDGFQCLVEVVAILINNLVDFAAPICIVFADLGKQRIEIADDGVWNKIVSQFEETIRAAVGTDAQRAAIPERPEQGGSEGVGIQDDQGRAPRLGEGRQLESHPYPVLGRFLSL